MIKRRILISALVLLLSANIATLASCGGNKDTTHDAGSDGQVVTESKNNVGDKNNNASDKSNGMTNNKNENGVVGEIITDVKDGAGNVVDDVIGNGMNGGNMNGNGTNSDVPPIDNGGIPARMRPIPRGK